MRKKARKRISGYKITAIIIPILIIVAILVAYMNDNTVRNKDLIIQISDITERAKFYPVELDGMDMSVLALKAPDGSIRTAFNTCQNCYSSGRGYYRQEGELLICQNCGNSFSLDGVELVSGGCNPVPITAENKIVTDSTITITMEYFTEAKSMFASWK